MSVFMIMMLSLVFGFILHCGAQMFLILALGVQQPAAMLVLIVTIPLQMILTMKALENAV